MAQNMTFQERLIKIRGTKNRDEFASKIGVSPRTIQRWELEDALPKGDELIKISKEYGVNLNWLLTGDGSPYLTGDTATNTDGTIKVTRDNKLIATIAEDELAFIRTMRFCGEDYKHRVYLAATVRAQRMMEEKRLETKEKLTAQKDLEIISLKAIE